jgi:hypothetical protein
LSSWTVEERRREARRTRSEGDQGNPGRTPPEPSASHRDIEDWFGRLVPHLRPVVEELDRSIRAAVPGVHDAVTWKRAFYGLPGLGWIGELAPYDVSVNVVFLGGADLDPPPALGTADRSRHVELAAREEVERPELQAWIRQAGRTPGWQ